MQIPDFLINNYKNWKLSDFPQNKDFYNKISINKQKPKAMIISCCDSRVNPEKILQGKAGDFFVHRNIANIVPSFDKKENCNTTSAVEYAVKMLKVPHIIIFGHSGCGGIECGYQMFVNKKINKDFISINSWIAQIKNVFQKSYLSHEKEKEISFYEKENIKNSIKNILSFPFVKNLTISNQINIHGIWFEIKTGKIHYFEEKNQHFIELV